MVARGCLFRLYYGGGGDGGLRFGGSEPLLPFFPIAPLGKQRNVEGEAILRSALGDDAARQPKPTAPRSVGRHARTLRRPKTSRSERVKRAGPRGTHAPYAARNEHAAKRAPRV